MTRAIHIQTSSLGYPLSGTDTSQSWNYFLMIFPSISYVYIYTYTQKCATSVTFRPSRIKLPAHSHCYKLGTFHWFFNFNFSFLSIFNQCLTLKSAASACSANFHLSSGAPWELCGVTTRVAALKQKTLGSEIGVFLLRKLISNAELISGKKLFHNCKLCLGCCIQLVTWILFYINEQKNGNWKNVCFVCLQNSRKKD